MYSVHVYVCEFPVPIAYIDIKVHAAVVTRTSNKDSLYHNIRGIQSIHVAGMGI